MEYGNQLETLPHVLYHCDSHAATRQLRHNRSAAASSLPSDQRVNQYVPDVDKDLAALRLDVVVTHVVQNCRHGRCDHILREQVHGVREGEVEKDTKIPAPRRLDAQKRLHRPCGRLRYRRPGCLAPS